MDKKIIAVIAVVVIVAAAGITTAAVLMNNKGSEDPLAYFNEAGLKVRLPAKPWKSLRKACVHI